MAFSNHDSNTATKRIVSKFISLKNSTTTRAPLVPTEQHSNVVIINSPLPQRHNRMESYKRPRQPPASHATQQPLLPLPPVSLEKPRNKTERNSNIYADTSRQFFGDHAAPATDNTPHAAMREKPSFRRGVNERDGAATPRHFSPLLSPELPSSRSSSSIDALYDRIRGYRSSTRSSCAESLTKKALPVITPPPPVDDDFDEIFFDISNLNFNNRKLIPSKDNKLQHRQNSDVDAWIPITSNAKRRSASARRRRNDDVDDIYSLHSFPVMLSSPMMAAKLQQQQQQQRDEESRIVKNACVSGSGTVIRNDSSDSSCIKSNFSNASRMQDNTGKRIISGGFLAAADKCRLQKAASRSLSVAGGRKAPTMISYRRKNRLSSAEASAHAPELKKGENFVTCRKCHKCRCGACRAPLQRAERINRWGRLICVDLCSCMWCARRCIDEDDDDEDVFNPASSSNAGSWRLMLLSLVCPCLCLYKPLKRAGSVCGTMCKRVVAHSACLCIDNNDGVDIISGDKSSKPKISGFTDQNPPPKTFNTYQDKNCDQNLPVFQQPSPPLSLSSSSSLSVSCLKPELFSSSLISTSTCADDGSSARKR